MFCNCILISMLNIVARKLKKIANQLDDEGFISYASVIDGLIKEAFARGMSRVWHQPYWELFKDNVAFTQDFYRNERDEKIHDGIRRPMKDDSGNFVIDEGYSDIIKRHLVELFGEQDWQSATMYEVVNVLMDKHSERDWQPTDEGRVIEEFNKIPQVEEMFPSGWIMWDDVRDPEYGKKPRFFRPLQSYLVHTDDGMQLKSDYDIKHGKGGGGFPSGDDTIGFIVRKHNKTHVKRDISREKIENEYGVKQLQPYIDIRVKFLDGGKDFEIKTYNSLLEARNLVYNSGKKVKSINYSSISEPTFELQYVVDHMLRPVQHVHRKRRSISESEEGYEHGFKRNIMQTEMLSKQQIAQEENVDINQLPDSFDFEIVRQGLENQPMRITNYTQLRGVRSISDLKCAIINEYNEPLIEFIMSFVPLNEDIKLREGLELKPVASDNRLKKMGFNSI